jgi:hypothetical protein
VLSCSKSNKIIRPSVKQSSSSKLGMSGDFVMVLDQRAGLGKIWGSPNCRHVPTAGKKD